MPNSFSKTDHEICQYFCHWERVSANLVERERSKLQMVPGSYEWENGRQKYDQVPLQASLNWSNLRPVSITYNSWKISPRRPHAVEVTVLKNLCMDNVLVQTESRECHSNLQGDKKILQETRIFVKLSRFNATFSEEERKPAWSNLLAIWCYGENEMHCTGAYDKAVTF